MSAEKTAVPLLTWALGLGMNTLQKKQSNSHMKAELSV